MVTITSKQKTVIFRTAACLIGLALVLEGCRGCQPSPQTPIEFAPAHTPAALWVPKLGHLMKQSAAFVQRAVPPGAMGLVTQTRNALQRQFDLDPLAPGALTQSGIAVDAGAAVFMEPSANQPVVVLKTTAHDQFNEALKRLVAKVDGAQELSSSQAHGYVVQTLGRRFGTEVVPVIHWSSVGPYALITSGGGMQALSSVLERSMAGYSQQAGATPSLVATKAFTELQKRVPEGQLLFYAQPRIPSELESVDNTHAKTESESQAVNEPAVGGAPAGGATKATAEDDQPKQVHNLSASEAAGEQKPGATMTSFRIGPEGFLSDSVFLTNDNRWSKIKADSALDLTQRIADDALLVMVSKVMTAKTMEAVEDHPVGASMIARIFQAIDKATGVRMRAEVSPLLSGPLTVAVHTRDLSDLPQLLRRLRSPSAAQGIVDVVLTADVRDGNAMKKVLERSAAAMVEGGKKIRQRQATVQEKSVTIFEPDTIEPGLAWAIMDMTYIYTVGPGRMDATLALLAGGGSKLPAALSEGVGGPLISQPNAFTIVLRPKALSDAARSLQLGSGLGAMGAAAMVASVGGLLENLGDIGLQVVPDEQSVRLSVREKLR